MSFLRIWKISFVGIVLFASCKENKPETIVVEKPDQDITMDESIELSQQWTKDEKFKIEQFIKRKGLEMETSPTGIRYFIYKENNPKGKYAKPGMVAKISYEIKLLDTDETLCYEADSLNPEYFLIEMDNVESGLHEAITYMKEGDQALIILPHYLAHGLTGNSDKIPPLSTIQYNIKLIELGEKQG